MVSVTSKITWNSAVLDRFKAAARVNGVAVGYQEGEKYPDGESVASVAMTHEFGTPKIPPRPWIRPTLDSRKGHWGRKIIEGLKIYKTEEKLRQMWANRGKAIVVNLQQAIDRVQTPPLAQYTIQRRKARGNNSTKPLVDTGKMRDSLSFKVAGGDWEQ